MAITVEQFIERLSESGLMSPAEVSAFQDSLPPDKRPKDVQQLASSLVKAGKLTKYQAQAVYQGRGKSLIFAEYVVLDKLGEGGMGVVFKAQHRRMDRLAAIKVLSSTAMKQVGAVERFQREVKAAAKLEHPNIVTAYDAGQHEGVHYLAMQYVDGKDLASIVKEHGPLDVQAAVECTLQAARGLQYAHSKGIVHRDIKPGNLLLDKEGTVKILDMGLARLEASSSRDDSGGERLTRSGQVMGTCEYMAPEQAFDTHMADARSDIYSLGCTLYRLLIGQPPYQGETLVQILLAHRERPIPSLCAARPEVPAEVDACFQRMVAKEPQDRYQSMGEVVAKLETVSAVLSGQSAMPAAAKVESSSAALSRTLAFLHEDSPAGTLTREKKPAVAEGTEPSISQPETGANLLGKVKQAVDKARRRPLVLVGVAGGLALLLGIILVVTPRHGGPAPSTEYSVPGIQPEAPPLAVAPFDASQARRHQEAWAKYLRVPVETTNSIGMKLVLIPPGEFLMGSPKDLIEAELKAHAGDPWWVERLPGEGPQHRARITKPFYLGAYVVTQGEYQRVMGTNPSEFSATGKQKDKAAGQDTQRLPAECVSWDDAAEFCRKLSDLPGEKAAGRTYLLPSEAQWEYACRAGSTGRYSFSSGHSGIPKEYEEKSLWDYGWFGDNPGGMPHAVGLKRASAWGLYDMHGNVWEWCQDWYDKDYYAKSPADDPTGPSGGSYRVLRGGVWNGPAWYCRSALRINYAVPGLRHNDLGFRACLVLPEK
jgi:serine/threonine-protein kinase